MGSLAKLIPVSLLAILVKVWPSLGRAATPGCPPCPWCP